MAELPGKALASFSPGDLGKTYYGVVSGVSYGYKSYGTAGVKSWADCDMESITSRNPYFDVM